MKRLYLIFFLLIGALESYCTNLHVDSTRYITGIRPNGQINFAVRTVDKGIFFVGVECCNPGGIIPPFPIDPSNGNVFVGKIDSNHILSWLKIYGGRGEDDGICACPTIDGGYAIAAYTNSNDGDITGAKGNGDIWLIRIDSVGNILWSRIYGSSQSDWPISISNTYDNGFIILGTTNGSDGDVPFHYGSFFSSDWLVIKTDSAGNVSWSKDIGTSENELDKGSIINVDSNYYLVSATAAWDHDCTDRSWHLGTFTGADIFIIKIDKSGNIIWNKSYGGSDHDEASTAIFDPSDSTIVINGKTSSNDFMVSGNHGNGDVWALKVDLDGNLIWQRALGSLQEENGTGICSTGNGYAILGTTFPGSFPDTTIGAIGVQDCWIWLLDQNGNVLTNKVFGGWDIDISQSIVQTAHGYAAVGVTGSHNFSEGITSGNDDTSAMYPNGGGAFVCYLDTINRSSIPSAIIADERNVKIYPNPAKNFVNVFLDRSEPYKIEVLDLLNELKYCSNLNVGLATINTANWAKGIYIVKVTDQSGTVFYKRIAID